MKLGLAILLAALAGAPAWAQTQQEMTRSAGEAFRRADAQLNLTYQRVLARTDRDNRDPLIKAEQAWVKYRDFSCDFEASGQVGGSVYPMIHAMCAERLTLSRTKELEHYQTCPQGDLSCPTPSPGR